MNKFDHSICIETEDIADCSYNAMREVSISEKTIDKIKSRVEETINSVK